MTEDRKVPTSAPADRPTFKLLVGGARISGEYQIQSVIVSRMVNRVASADLLILDGDPATEDFKVSNADDFVPGGEIEILAGYHGQEETIFKGIIVRHGLRVYQKKPSVLRVECRDAAVKLTVGRKSAYYYEATDSDVIEEMAGKAGLDKVVEATTVTHPQMVQFYSTDWDFILTRAEANGKIVVTQDGMLRVVSPDASQEPALALSYGGNLLDFEAVAESRDQFTAVNSFSWDAANQEMLDIDGAASSAVSPGNLTHDDLASVIGLEALHLKHAGQIPDSELQAWADAQRQKSDFAKVRGRVRVQGFGTIKPGDVIELGGVGERFAGKALVSGVRHEINTKNWETDMSFGLDPEWFGRSAERIVEPKANGLLPGVTGLQIGLVTALEGDPDGEDRIQIRIPLIDPSEEGTWARIATLDAGENRGTFFRPEIGDEVLLGFLNDDPRNPVVLGMLNSSAKPASLQASDDNHEKGIFTRSQMKVLFNDDKKTITIETPNGNVVHLSDEDGEISVKDENSNSYVMNADGITIESAADINIKASGDVNIEGTNLSSAANAQFKAEGSAGAELSSGGTSVLKGAIVQIN